MSIVHEKSIILIGHLAAGKSSTAEILSRDLNMPHISVDIYFEKMMKGDWAPRSDDEMEKFFVDSIKYMLKQKLETNTPFVMDFGAIHSCIKDTDLFIELRNALSPFKNVIFLRIHEDDEVASEISLKRLKGDKRYDRRIVKDRDKFIKSGNNAFLAKKVLTTHDLTKEEVAKKVRGLLSTNQPSCDL